MEQVYTPTEGYKVLVMCMTYNQSKYIEDALNGFVIQKTDFPFTCLVMDDASTDGEQEIISSWMDQECNMEKAQYMELELSNVIIVPHKVNASCSFAFYLLKQNLFKTGKKNPLINEWKERCKYVALCEGDDCWTDPDKLQKQVDFLESHPDFSMCFHAANIISSTSYKLEFSVDKVENKEYFTNDIFPKWQVPTASVLYRKDLVDSYRTLEHSDWFLYGDIVLFLKCSHTGRIWGISEKMSVYRRLDSGISNTRDILNYRERYTKHIMALELNFPQISKEYFAQFFYSEIFHEPSIYKRIVYSIRVLKFSPSLFINKSRTILKHLLP